MPECGIRDRTWMHPGGDHLSDCWDRQDTPCLSGFPPASFSPAWRAELLYGDEAESHSPWLQERAKDKRCCRDTKADLVVLCQVVCGCRILHPALLGLGPSWGNGYRQHGVGNEPESHCLPAHCLALLVLTTPGLQHRKNFTVDFAQCRENT